MSFAACSKKENNQSAQISNPWTSYDSLEALNEKFGAFMAKPESFEVKNESFSGIFKDNDRLAEYQFEIDGFEYTLRFSDVNLQ